MFEQEIPAGQSKDVPEFRGHGTIKNICVGKDDFDPNQNVPTSNHGSHTSHSSK